MTKQEPRWYSVNNMGMATLCADKADAENVASDCDTEWPRQAPHRAVQLVEVSGCRIGRDEILSMALDAGICDSHGHVIQHELPNLERFAELLTRPERAARIEAQQRLADMQELAAKSGLAHRMAVQAAVAEAVAEERAKIQQLQAQLQIHSGWLSNQNAEARRDLNAESEVCATLCDQIDECGGSAKDCAIAIRARGTP